LLGNLGWWRGHFSARWPEVFLHYRNAESANERHDVPDLPGIFQDGQAYKVRITRLGNFVQEADGFSSYLDAESWVAQDRRIAVIEEQKEPRPSAHLRVV
jgi:hypothetical protein